MSTEAFPRDGMTAPLEAVTDWRADTITSFPAIRDDTPPPAPAGACRCGVPGCPDGPPLPLPAETRTLLSCAPGVTSRMWRTWVAQGKWKDIPAEFDQAHARIHMPALVQNRAIRGEVAARRHDIAAMLTRSPSLLADRVLSDGLHDLECRLAERLADMRAEAQERSAA